MKNYVKLDAKYVDRVNAQNNFIAFNRKRKCIINRNGSVLKNTINHIYIKQ